MTAIAEVKKWGVNEEMSGFGNTEYTKPTFPPASGYATL
jgi:hypothetical protein